jgi:hypothetical protein
MQFLLVTQQAKGIDEPDQAKVMVAVQVRNEDMRDLTPPDLIIDQLDLGAFTTIHQVIAPVKGHYLAGRMPVKSRNGRIISKYRNGEHEWFDSNLKTKKTKTKTIREVLLFE